MGQGRSYRKNIGHNTSRAAKNRSNARAFLKVERSSPGKVTQGRNGGVSKMASHGL